MHSRGTGRTAGTNELEKGDEHDLCPLFSPWPMQPSVGSRAIPEGTTSGAELVPGVSGQVKPLSSPLCLPTNQHTHG